MTDGRSGGALDEPRELTLRGDLCEEVGASGRGDRLRPMEHQEHSNAVAFEAIRQTRPSLEDLPEPGRAAPGAVPDDGEASLAVDLTRLSGHKPADFDAGSSSRRALVHHIGFDPTAVPHLDGHPGAGDEDRRSNGAETDDGHPHPDEAISADDDATARTAVAARGSRRAGGWGERGT